jgi:hypothetical protein
MTAKLTEAAQGIGERCCSQYCPRGDFLCDAKKVFGHGVAPFLR